MNRQPQFVEARPGVRLATLADGPADAGATCGWLWLGGFMSDMTGSKAEVLAGLAGQVGRPCLRFDYSGHGASGGSFAEGTISLWLAEAVTMFRRLTRGPRVIVGSSMGGWLAALLYRALGVDAQRIAGLVLVAPAHDMTEALLWNSFSDEARATLMRDGVWHRPSAYGAPYPITRALIEDGRRHLMLAAPMQVHCPVRILQGEADPDVPWQHALRIYEQIDAADVRFTLVKGGDHRLSRPGDLDLLRQAALELAERS